MVLALKQEQIGGALVRRTFTSGGRRLIRGEQLSREEVLAMPVMNRNALVNKNYMDLIPQIGAEVGTVTPRATVAPTGAEKFVISVGFGKFMVIEGRKLSDEPMNREQACALAGLPVTNKRSTRSRKKQP